MAKANSTARSRTRKPKKTKLPHGNSLILRADVRFCKKLLGKPYYFGRFETNDGGVSIQAALDQ